MWILIAEALLALVVLAFIVAWTLGPTHRREQKERRALEERRREEEDR